MIYFYDTEFLEDGSTIDLISIGIVALDGREYYAVNSDFDLKRLEHDTWMLTNVVPHLPLGRTGRSRMDAWLKHSRNSYPQPSIPEDLDLTDTRVKPKWVIANEVREFLLTDGNFDESGGGHYRNPPELWAYYGAYDHVALAQLWGKMIHLPSGIPMFTHDLIQMVELVGGVGKFDVPNSDKHDALADARWNRELYRAVVGL